MSTVVLLRHGRSSANNAHVLAGRSPGIELDETGRAQAAALVQRLAGLSITGLVCSPLVRCMQTLGPLSAATGLPIFPDERLTEVDYGSWTGRGLADLAAEPLWRIVQHHPSGAVFPGGEALAAVSVRAVAAAREHGADGDGGVTVLCSHGDVIKAIVADALGMHLDSFQRIVIDTGSVSVIRYDPLRPFVERMNDTGSLVASGRPSPPVGEGGDAVIGGDPGASEPAAAAAPTVDATCLHTPVA